jgi:hypothetical protein
LGVLQAVVCFFDYVLQHGLPLDGMHKKDIANLTKYTHDPRPFTKEVK